MIFNECRIPSYLEMDRLAALNLSFSSMWHGNETAFWLHVMTGLGKHFGITGGTWQNLAESYFLQPGHHNVREERSGFTAKHSAVHTASGRDGVRA